MPPCNRPSFGGPTDSAFTFGSAGLKLVAVVFVVLPGRALAETSVLARRPGACDFAVLARVVVVVCGAACAWLMGQLTSAKMKVRVRNRSGLRTMWDIRPLICAGQISDRSFDRSGLAPSPLVALGAYEQGLPERP